MGLAMSVLTRLMLKFIHRRGHKAPEQLTLTIAMAYLTYYFGQLAGGALCLERSRVCSALIVRCMQLPRPPSVITHPRSASNTQGLSAGHWTSGL